MKKISLAGESEGEIQLMPKRWRWRRPGMQRWRIAALSESSESETSIMKTWQRQWKHGVKPGIAGVAKKTERRWAYQRGETVKARRYESEWRNENEININKLYRRREVSREKICWRPWERNGSVKKKRMKRKWCEIEEEENTWSQLKLSEAIWLWEKLWRSQ